MASAYPGSLDNFTTADNDATVMATNHAAQHNDANDAINKIEAELGTNPSGSFTDVKARVDALETSVLNSQTGTTYTLVLADQNKIVGMSNASPNTLTVPTNASVAFPVGTIITIRQGGAGLSSFAAAGGVTLSSRGGATDMAGQYGYATLVKVATNIWELSGDIA